MSSPWYTCSLNCTRITLTFLHSLLLFSWDFLGVYHCNKHRTSLCTTLCTVKSLLPWYLLTGSPGLGFLYFTSTFLTLASSPGYALDTLPSLQLPRTWFESWISTLLSTLTLRFFVCHFCCTIILGKKSLVHFLQKASTICWTNSKRWFGCQTGTLEVDRPKRRSFGHR